MSILALQLGRHIDRSLLHGRHPLRSLLGIAINVTGAVLVGAQAVQALLALMRG